MFKKKKIKEEHKRKNCGLISQRDLLKLINSQELYVSPLLEDSQIGSISIDLRVGTDFLALNQGRDEFIDTSDNKQSNRPITGHFSSSRRKLGESFLLHPGQTILFSTLEYIKLPNYVYSDLTLRSSYSRLGLQLSTFLQPGYCGCASIEIINHSNTIIKIISGSRMIQSRFYWTDDDHDYFENERKYSCQVRPVSSKANEDSDLNRLRNLYDN